MKTCASCKRSLQLSEFYKNRSKAGGLHHNCKACERERHKKKPRLVSKERRRAYNLHRYHSITDRDYAELFAAQSGLCAICGEVAPPGRHLVVDHCHSTTAIRGLLCPACNQGIWLLRDEPEIVKRAVAYLEGSRTGLISVPAPPLRLVVNK